jgi:uncharacterized protein
MSQLWLAFITGLTTGGISCFAVQGGLLASSLSNQKQKSEKALVSVFLVSKLLSYTLLGILLGILGSKLAISSRLQGVMQILAGIFMLVSVGKLLDIHPIFRYFTITPPKSIFRLLRKKSLDEGFFSAGILGALTILIPCGVTQSMMLLSIASGSAILGGLILGAFVLGTSPIFFALGIASGEILKRKSLKYVAAIVITILGIVSINSGQILRGSVHTLQNYYAVTTGKLDNDSTGNLADVSNSGIQEVTIQVNNTGYESDVDTIKAGIPVKLNLISNNALGCSRSFTIPEYNISQILPQTGSAVVEFTPTRKGRLTYTCSMGMYTGWFNVI